MLRGLSLANKVLLVYGVAIFVIVFAALIAPGVRIRSTVDASQFETGRRIAELFELGAIELGAGDVVMLDSFEDAGPAFEVRFVDPTASATGAARADSAAEARFIATALERLDIGLPPQGDDADDRSDDPKLEYTEASSEGGARRYRLARVVQGGLGDRPGVVMVSFASRRATSLVFVDRLLMIVSGLAAWFVAFALFFFVTKRIVLGPVRELTDTAELVRAGNTAIRSEIKTGDEFEQLSEAFNAMLSNMVEQQQLLRSINKSLDLRMNELAEANVSLYEAARLKGEFLASVSHELRTPLNSIIGFAEILRDIADRDLERLHAQHEPDESRLQQLEKRRRYTDNIVTAGRTLLEMINELLTMAKIEAGRIELRISEMNVADSCEGLLALIRPLAEKKDIRLSLRLGASTLPGFSGKPGADLPILRTDPTKLEQVVFNFLSNAVKFTPEGGDVTLRAERISAADASPRVRISVLDTGPGIAPEHQQAIFEKFRQVEEGHTRSVTGTGLGLAIAKQFVEMLQGEIQLVSETGRGSMFSVILPVHIDERRAAEQARLNDELSARGADPGALHRLQQRAADSMDNADTAMGVAVVDDDDPAHDADRPSQDPTDHSLGDGT